MIDVLHVITGLGTGGAETMLLHLAPRLQRRGLRQHVASLSDQDALAGDVRAAGVGVTVLGAGSALARIPALLALLRLVGRLRPRILQGWMYHGNIAATLAHYLCPGRRERRLMWNLRASNMDEARYGRILRLSGLLSGAPDCIVANSQAGVAFHIARGLKPRNVTVVPNGIDTEKFRADTAARAQVRAELGIEADAVVVIHVARVDPMKDHETFLAAMAQLPSVAGLMVGDGTPKLASPANVRALGMRRDIERLYAAADVVVSTSAFGEGFSNVIAEGMSAGLVPVATDVGDAGLIVGDTGFVVPPRDADAFRRAVAGVVSLAKDERARRGALAAQRIRANFSIATAVDRYHSLYATGAADEASKA
jgi:glycosyltransferase involved in cell wall biosynthesis